MLLAELVATSAQVATTSARNDKVALLAELIGRADPSEIEVVVAALCGTPRQGRVGVGWVTARMEGRASVPTLTVTDLDRLIDSLDSAGGTGVQSVRRDLLDGFGARATPGEADFAVRLLTGELRQGALAGVAEKALASSEGVPVGVVRRAAMLTGDLPGTATLARTGGRPALEAVLLRLGVPVGPMLAASAPSVEEALDDLGSASVEWKLDGIRVQAHVRGDRVRLFTRNLNDVTDRLEEVAAQLAGLDLPVTVLDGEVIAEDAEGRPAAFQDTVSSDREGHSMRAHWFDLLHHAGADLLDDPLADRRAVMHSIEGLELIHSASTADSSRAGEVMAAALGAGHEGVVLKALDSVYAAGRRGRSWRKVKPVHTLDLVVMGVEWGSGRRRGTLSNLHLGALGDDGAPVMVGKTFKGLTDELLAWQTAELLAREVGREGHVVWVRPELVVEIAVDGAQRSTRYPGGAALRFARVRRYRTDKTAAEADTIENVRALLPG